MRKNALTEGRITPSKEDYLERIYDLSLVDENVRSVDVARALNVSRASVNKSIGGLKEDGYIEQEHYGTISLTVKGRQIAKEVRTKHNMIRSFLTGVLGVSYETADIEACEIEHAIGKDTAKKLKAFLDKQGIKVESSEKKK